MSPQEREKWKAEFRGYCCSGSPSLPTGRVDEATATTAKARPSQTVQDSNPVKLG
jgi:hypothetical protein